MGRKKISAFLGSLIVTTALAGCSQSYSVEELRKKYETPNTTVESLDDPMSDYFYVYKTLSGEIVEKKSQEDESGVVNYIFVSKLEDGQYFPENVDQSTYLLYNVGDKIKITLESKLTKDTEVTVSSSAHVIYSQENALEKER